MINPAYVPPRDLSGKLDNIKTQKMIVPMPLSL